MIHEIFDHLYCLNLPKRTDRRARCEQIFKEYGWDVQFFNAIDGTRLYCPNMLLPGEWGAALSHTAILRDAQEHNYQRILVMEDDVEFCDNFLARFEEAYADVPRNWDMLYGGANHERPYTRITDKVVKCGYAFTLHFVGLHRSMFVPILSKTITKPIDVHYADFHGSVNAYAMCPSLVWQEKGYSDIQLKNVDYEVLRRT